MRPEETVDFTIRSAWHKIARMYNNKASSYNLSMAVGQVLLNIDQKAGTPSTKLGPKMGMEATSLSRILKSMEDNSLIYRQVDEKDKRMVRIFITEEGREKRELSRKEVLNFNHRVHEQVSKKKLESFFEVMQNIESIIEDQENNNEKKNK